jgi:HSF-type DNA-binding
MSLYFDLPETSKHTSRNAIPMGSTQEDVVAAVLAELGKAAVPFEALAFETPSSHQKGCAKSQNPTEKTAVAQNDSHRDHKDDAGPRVASVFAEPKVVQLVKISKSRQDHSYRDYSTIPPHEGYEPQSNLESMSFSEKMHDILSAPEHSNTIRWMSHGRAFHVDVPKNMEKHGILMKYFKHGRYSSFLRQLNNHGFKHLTVGPDRNCYYHEVCMWANKNKGSMLTVDTI